MISLLTAQCIPQSNGLFSITMLVKDAVNVFLKYIGTLLMWFNMAVLTEFGFKSQYVKKVKSLHGI